jgi:hypothetical protein
MLTKDCNSKAKGKKQKMHMIGAKITNKCMLPTSLPSFFFSNKTGKLGVLQKHRVCDGSQLFVLD